MLGLNVTETVPAELSDDEQRTSFLSRVGLPWPRPPSKAGRRGKVWHWRDAIYALIDAKDWQRLSQVKSADPPRGWQQGMPVVSSADDVEQVADREVVAALGEEDAGAENEREEAEAEAAGEAEAEAAGEAEVEAAGEAEVAAAGDAEAEVGGRARKRRRKTTVSNAAKAWFIAFRDRMGSLPAKRRWSHSKCVDWCQHAMPEVFGSIDRSTPAHWTLESLQHAPTRGKRILNMSRGRQLLCCMIW